MSSATKLSSEDEMRIIADFTRRFTVTRRVIFREIEPPLTSSLVFIEPRKQEVCVVDIVVLASKTSWRTITFSD